MDRPAGITQFKVGDRIHVNLKPSDNTIGNIVKVNVMHEFIAWECAIHCSFGHLPEGTGLRHELPFALSIYTHAQVHHIGNCTECLQYCKDISEPYDRFSDLEVA